MSMRRRHDPFAVSANIGRNNRRRVDRTGAPVASRAAGVRSEASRPVRVRALNASMIMVVPDNDRCALSKLDLLAVNAAHLLAGEQEAILILCFGDCGEGLTELGIDRIVRLPACDHPEKKASMLANVAVRLSVRLTVFPASKAGADLACRLAAATDAEIAHNASGIEGDRLVERVNETSERLMAPPAVIIISPQFVAPPSGADGQLLELVVESPAFAPETVQYDKPSRSLPGQVPLAEAEAILAGGNGIHDWEVFGKLAQALGLPLGASRVAVDAGHIPRSRQIGTSGNIVEARTYLAFGISGAPQHLEGIQACQAVLAVNTDPACAMMQRAHLAIVADANVVAATILGRLAADA